MFIPRDELPLYALAVIASALIFRWALLEIIRAIRDRGIPKCRWCDACGARVWFRKPLELELKLPTRAELYAASGQVVEAMARAEGIPVLTAPPERYTLEEETEQEERTHETRMEDLGVLAVAGDVGRGDGGASRP